MWLLDYFQAYKVKKKIKWMMYSGDVAYAVLLIMTQLMVAELCLQSKYPSVDECIEYLSL